MLIVLQADLDDERFEDTVVFDVRRPEEIAETGALGPEVVNIPVEEIMGGAFGLDDDDFLEQYGVPKPGADADLIFSCR